MTAEQKENRKAYLKIWYAKNRIRINEYHRNWDRKRNQKPVPVKTVSTLQILKAVSDYFKIEIEFLESDMRVTDIKNARYFYFLLSRELTNEKLLSIGLEVNRSHSAVVIGISKLKKKMDSCETTKKHYNDLKLIIQAIEVKSL